MTTKEHLLSANTIAAVERLARSDPRLAATVDQWDRDPWLLNTPAGTVELKTGKVREHRRLDYITKITAASPGGDCPLWREFIRTITGHTGGANDAASAPTASERREEIPPERVPSLSSCLVYTALQPLLVIARNPKLKSEQVGEGGL
jgi:hypothetical protein